MRKLLVTALLLGVSAPALAQDVLVLHAAFAYGPEVGTRLVNSGRFTSVDVWDGGISTPTLVDLLQYDAVFVMPDTYFADGATLGDNLAAYVDQGGGVVDTVFSVNWGALYVSNAWYNNGYRPFEGTTQGNLNGSLVPVLPNNPMLTGVTNFGFTNLGYYGPDVAMRPGATLIAQWDNGVPLLAAWQPTGAGVVVGLNAYMPSYDTASFGWDPAIHDGQTLLANVVEFAANGTVTPVLTSVSTGACPGSSTLTVTNASPGGDVAFVTGTLGGNFTIPSGNCAGTSIPLGAPRLRATITANAQGTISRNVNLSQGLCNVPFLVVDLDTCDVSAPSPL